MSTSTHPAGAVPVRRAAPAAPAASAAPAAAGRLAPSVAREIAQPGRALAPSTRVGLERRFGADLSQVRVHTSAAAGASAQEIGARAYTVGQHVVFSPGRFAPDTAWGRHLLAHEVAHTIQQSGGGQLAAPAGHGQFEQAADAAAAGKGPVAVRGRASPWLAMSPESPGDPPAPDTSQRGTAADVAAYARLRQLQDNADQRAHELMDGVIRQRMAQWEASNAARTAAGEKFDEPVEVRRQNKLGTIKGDLTVGVAYAVDENGNLHELVTTSRGTSRKLVDLKGDESWVKAVRQSTPKAPAASTGPAPAGGTAGAPAPVVVAPAPAVGAVAAQHQSGGGAGSAAPAAPAAQAAQAAQAAPAAPAADQPSRRRTAESAIRDAEARLVAHAAKNNLHLVAVGASSDVCPHCAEKLGRAGATAATRRQRDELNAPVPSNVSPALESVKRLPPSPARPEPEVVYRRPRSTGSGPSGPSGPAAPPAASPPTVAPVVPVPLPGKAAPVQAPPVPGPAPPVPEAQSGEDDQILQKAQSTKPAAAKPAAPQTPTAPTPTPTPATPTAPAQAPAAQAPTTPAPAPVPPSPAKPPAVVNVSGDLSKITRSSTTVDPGGEGASPSTTKRSTQVGWGGVGATTERQTGTPGQGPITKSATGTTVTRGEAGLSLTRGRDVTQGVVDENGTLVSGTQTSTRVGGGLIAGPSGYGVAGAASAQQTTAYGNGFQTTKSLGGKSSAVVNATRVEGTEPPRYRLVITLNLAASATLGAAVGQRATAGGSVSVSGAITGSFVHVFSAEQTTRYLGDLGRGGATGAERELRVVELATQGSVDDARALLSTLLSPLSAQAASNLAEGDEASLEVQGSVGVGAKVAGGGRSPVGAEVSFSRSKSLKRTVARMPGAVLVTIDVVAEQGGTVGVSGSSGAVGGGLTYGQTDSSSRSVTFRLDPKSASYQADFDRVLAVDDADGLTALASAASTLVISSGIGTGTRSTITPKVSILGAEASIAQSHAYAEKEVRDASGTHRQFTGSSGGGLSVGVVGGPKVSFHSEQAVSTTVTPGVGASGDVSTTTTETDVGASARALIVAAEKSPLGQTLGLATGGTSLLQSSTEVSGMHLSDQDYAAIAAASADRSRWNHAFRGRVNQSFIAWQALGRAIAASNGDRAEIGKALARYGADNDQAADAVQAVVRRSGQAEGGIRYDWPSDLTEQRRVFETLVTGNRLAQLDAIESRGGFEEARSALIADNARLTAVSKAVIAASDRFSDAAAVAEMLRRIGDTQSTIRARVRKLDAALAPVEPAGAKPAASSSGARSAKDPAGGLAAQADPGAAAADAQAARADRNARIDALIPAMLTLRDRERAVFTEVRNELDHTPWYRKPDAIGVIQTLNRLEPLYTQWDVLVEKLRAVYRERGENGSRADEFGPDRKTWNELRRHRELTRQG